MPHLLVNQYYWKNCLEGSVLSVPEKNQLRDILLKLEKVQDRFNQKSPVPTDKDWLANHLPLKSELRDFADRVHRAHPEQAQQIQEFAIKLFAARSQRISDLYHCLQVDYDRGKRMQDLILRDRLVAECERLLQEPYRANDLKKEALNHKALGSLRREYLKKASELANKFQDKLLQVQLFNWKNLDGIAVYEAVHQYYKDRGSQDLKGFSQVRKALDKVTQKQFEEVEALFNGFPAQAEETIERLRRVKDREATTYYEHRSNQSWWKFLADRYQKIADYAKLPPLPTDLEFQKQEGLEVAISEFRARHQEVMRFLETLEQRLGDDASLLPHTEDYAKFSDAEQLCWRLIKPQLSRRRPDGGSPKTLKEGVPAEIDAPIMEMAQRCERIRQKVTPLPTHYDEPDYQIDRLKPTKSRYRGWKRKLSNLMTLMRSLFVRSPRNLALLRLLRASVTFPNPHDCGGHFLHTSYSSHLTQLNALAKTPGRPYPIPPKTFRFIAWFLYPQSPVAPNSDITRELPSAGRELDPLKYPVLMGAGQFHPMKTVRLRNAIRTHGKKVNAAYADVLDEVELLLKWQRKHPIKFLFGGISKSMQGNFDQKLSTLVTTTQGFWGADPYLAVCYRQRIGNSRGFS